MDTTRLSDKRFFCECVDTTIPELSALPSLAEKGDYAEAYKVFAAYVRKTLNPDRYLADSKAKLADDSERITAAAKRAMEHTFISCRVPHTFGEEIDWDHNPTYNGYEEWPWQLNRHHEWRMLGHLYRETGDIYLVADVLGHSDVNTTRRHYAAMSDERRRLAAKKVTLRDDEAPREITDEVLKIATDQENQTKPDTSKTES